MASRSATFYIDNNAMLAILMNSAKPIPKQAMTGLIWNRIRERNIHPRPGRVPSKRNISDLPKRGAKSDNDA